MSEVACQKFPYKWCFLSKFIHFPIDCFRCSIISNYRSEHWNLTSLNCLAAARALQTQHYFAIFWPHARPHKKWACSHEYLSQRSVKMTYFGGVDSFNKPETQNPRKKAEFGQNFLGYNIYKVRKTNRTICHAGDCFRTAFNPLLSFFCSPVIFIVFCLSKVWGLKDAWMYWPSLHIRSYLLCSKPPLL